MSPNDTRVAFARDGDIWVHDLARGGQTRVTTDPHEDSLPVWDPAGDRLVFSSNRVGNSEGQYAVFQRASDGTGDVELVYSDPDRSLRPTSWSADGGTVFLYQFVGGAYSLGAVSMGQDHRLETLLPPSLGLGVWWPELSPDGRWLAYVSTETGSNEIYLRSYPDLEGRRWSVSTNVAVEPVWSRDGRQLFYRDSDLKAMMSVEVRSEALVSIGTPTFLFEDDYYMPINARDYDVAADGRFVIVKEGLAGGAPGIRVIQNWSQALDE